MERVLYEVKKIIVGQDNLLERLIVALLARGHILVEGVPGLAKTMAIKTLAQSIGGEFQRIQFTPDLVPADLIGTRIYNQKTGEFNTALGPSSPTCCWRTKSTAPRPKCRAPCWK
jgi:MoxR-like ATPase